MAKNDYSVPVAYGHRDVWIRGIMPEACLRHDVDMVVIGCGGEGEPRGRHRFDPLHSLPLIERKSEPSERHWSE